MEIVFILLILVSIALFINKIEFKDYKKKNNKRINNLVNRMKNYEHNQNCVFDEIVSLKGVDYHKKRKNSK